ncbi:ROK family protein, partial [candidate division KSB1 bacterium]
MDFSNQAIIGVDLGGTKIHAARIRNGKVEEAVREIISAGAGERQVLDEVFQTIDRVKDGGIAAIGIGVPGLV